MRERSSRNKKKISYDSTSDDDDFADDTPPPKKNRKTKSITQAVTKPDTKPKPQVETAKEQTSKRLSIDEKIFQRNLQAVIKTSQNQDAPEKEENNKENDSDYTCERVPSSSEDSDFSDGSEFAPSPVFKKKTKEPKPSRNVIKIKTKSKTKNDPVKRDVTPDIKTFNITNPKETSTEVKTTSKKAQEDHVVPREGERTPDVKVLPTKRSVSTIVTGTKPDDKPAVTPTVKGIKQISPVLQGRPKWTPPGSSRGVSSPLAAVSPNTGLRLGLSRNSKLKPLHSNVKIM